MNNREKLLVAVVGCAALAFVGNLVYGSYSKSLTKLRTDLTKSQTEDKDLELKLRVARNSENKLKIWRDQSLPNSSTQPNDLDAQEEALSNYTSWINATLKKHGLEPGKNQRLQPTQLASSIGTIGVQVETKGSLTSLVEFLHQFYSTPLLHQITRLDLRPEAGALKVTMQAEALMLPSATTEKVPPEGKLSPFKLADVSDYRKAIVGRDIFTAYKKPTDIETPVAKKDDPLDESRFAKFTSTNLGTKGLVAWIYKMNSGDTLFVSAGDPVNVGSWKGKVVTVENRALVLEHDNKHVRVDIGGLLKDAKPLPNQPKPQVPAADYEDDENAG